MPDTRDVDHYEILARIYDRVMDDVDYEAWADYIDELIQHHHEDPIRILELACGTGTMAISLDELECYEIVATDRSPAMIEVARRKGRELNAGVEFRVMDFLDVSVDQRFDVAVSVFDSVNYLMEPGEILQMLQQVAKALKPGGLFVFDFTTPRNSIQAINYLNNDEGTGPGNLRYFRTSRYDPRQQIHYNEFDIEELDEKHRTVVRRFRETHRQRIYTLKEMLAIIAETDYKILAKYSGFEMVEADNKSLRITMVLQCPITPS